jgi:hypothetical protein
MIQIFATFEYSTHLEMAITSLEVQGIHKESIFAVPLTNRIVEKKIFDTLHHSDGMSFTSTGAAIGTACSVVGAGVGFSLKWGPIYWGLIGGVGGFLLGVIIDLVVYKVIKKRQRHLQEKKSDVILIVECEDTQVDFVENTLWNHLALGTARIKL